MNRFSQRPGECLCTGLSTDTKPSNALDGFCFIETDTGKFYRRILGLWTYIPVQALPVNFVYLNIVDVNPSITLGYGTWTRVGQNNLPILGPPPSVLPIFVYKRVL